MKTIKCKRIGLFYLEISDEFSSGTQTTKYLAFPSFFLTMHCSVGLISYINSAKKHTEKAYALDKAKLDKGNTYDLIMLTLKLCWVKQSSL